MLVIISWGRCNEISVNKPFKRKGRDYTKKLLSQRASSWQEREYNDKVSRNGAGKMCGFVYVDKVAFLVEAVDDRRHAKGEANNAQEVVDEFHDNRSHRLAQLGCKKCAQPCEFEHEYAPDGNDAEECMIRREMPRSCPPLFLPDVFDHDAAYATNCPRHLKSPVNVRSRSSAQASAPEIFICDTDNGLGHE